MRINKIGSVFLISVLALAAIGVSYAAWYDQIDINATATTGNLEYRITKFAVTDESKIGGFDVSSWTGVGNYPGEPDSITITVQPTYPGWKAICQLTVKNTGNLPLEMYSLKMTYVGGDSNLMNYYYWGIPDGIILPPNNVYWLNTFNWWTTERTYSSLGTPVITIQPGTSFNLEGYFWLDPNVPQWEGHALTVTLTLYATTAAIT